MFIHIRFKQILSTVYTLENIISELDNYFGILPNIDYVGKS